MILQTVRLLLLLAAVYPPCLGHGRLVEPPSRASMWRLGYDTPPNYNDNQMFCGGVQVQYVKNGGRCGVCGDPWDGERLHEKGGKYATGKIVRQYEQGGEIDVHAQLTANHKGYMEFFICPTIDGYHEVTATQECFNKNPLRLVGDDSGETKLLVKDEKQREFKYRLKIPNNVRCDACVLQWQYTAGNSWGINDDGYSCVGCGNQEQFYGCADIAVGSNNVELTIPRRNGNIPEVNYGADNVYAPGYEPAQFTVKTNTEACDQRIDEENPKYYKQFVQGWGWMRRPCAPGTCFELSDCQCSTFCHFK